MDRLLDWVCRHIRWGGPVTEPWPEDTLATPIAPVTHLGN